MCKIKISSIASCMMFTKFKVVFLVFSISEVGSLCLTIHQQQCDHLEVTMCKSDQVLFSLVCFAEFFLLDM